MRHPPPIPQEALRERRSVDEMSPELLETVPPPVPLEALRRRRKILNVPPPVPVAAMPRKGDVRPAAHATPIETADLVAAARNGNHSAFETLVIRYRPRILALALHLTGSATDAEDVSQDVFLRAYQRLHEFEGRSAFFTWIYRIALNRSLQLMQKRRYRLGVNLDDPRVAIAVAIDSYDTPERAIELRETYTQLLCAFDRLTPLLRTTVVLTTLQGLSHPEAASVLNTTEGTIGWRMHEAREQLRRSLDAARRGEVPVDEPVVERPKKRVSRRTESEPDSMSYALAVALVSVVSV
jgi:RNA polymerase sigma-70 factor, ECF subfamily